MGLRALAEGILLQSIEDLWDDNAREECIAFFRGGDFRVCADAAGLNVIDQVKLLHMVKDVVELRRKKEETGKSSRKTREKNMQRCHTEATSLWR